ncbi:hypothetical protein [Leptospira hartskeerlii]|uniref:hypothetical protein n=1 Tax=Leptospira hartskeerlii TaxID=2023177 RepID=UPI0013FDED10|nr:hypothetical protein [Leptospira hartskeerlii]
MASIGSTFAWVVDPFIDLFVSNFFSILFDMQVFTCILFSYKRNEWMLIMFLRRWEIRHAESCWTFYMRRMAKLWASFASTWT